MSFPDPDEAFPSTDASFEDVMRHYGVPGMRWGVHRSKGSTSSKKSKPKKSPATPEQIARRKEIGKKIAKSLLISGAVVGASIAAGPIAGAGAAAAANILNIIGSTPAHMVTVKSSVGGDGTVTAWRPAGHTINND